MITMIVMTAAKKTNPPNMPSAMIPPIFNRAAAILDGLPRKFLVGFKGPSGISLSAIRLCVIDGFCVFGR